MHALVAVSMLLFTVAATNPSKSQPVLSAPELSDARDYAEYWEQQFYFETGTLLTSQFLITNLPISKHHGLMVASLKRADEPAVIIKNGRGRDGWSYDSETPMLSIFQHDLEGRHPGYLLRLNNTAAEVDALFNASLDPIELVEKGNTLNLPEVTLYAPASQAFGRWRAGPEIGGLGPEGDWLSLGSGHGYALHVRQDRPLGQSLQRWVRITPTENKGAYSLILHHFETPEGQSKTETILVPRFGEPVSLTDTTLTDDDGKCGMIMHGDTLQARITRTRELETFLIADQLNGVEKLVAGSLADISRYRWLANYKLEGSVQDQPVSVSGTAILEEILIGKPRKNRRRLRR